MKVLILQHQESTPPGSTPQWCESRGHSCQILMVPETENLLERQDWDLLVICGGGMNVDEEEKFPWLKTEKQFIQQALQSGRKMVGLCLGAQLLAEALGGVVQKHPHWEVGWHAVQLAHGQNLMAFQWHGYSFSLPPGAERQASNAICKEQAFSWKNQVLGFQFHPETTRKWALECAENPRLPTTGFVQTAAEIKHDLRYQPALQSWYFQQLDELISKPL